MLSKKISILLLLTLVTIINISTASPSLAKDKSIKEEEFTSILKKAQALREKEISQGNSLSFKLSTNLDPEVSQIVYSSRKDGYASLLRVDKSGEILNKEFYSYKEKAVSSWSQRSLLFFKVLKHELKNKDDVTGIKFTKAPSERLPPGITVTLLKSEGKVPFGIDTLNNYLKSQELYSNYIGSAKAGEDLFYSIRENKNHECREVITLSLDKGILVKNKIDLLFKGKLVGSVSLEYTPISKFKPLGGKAIAWERVESGETYLELKTLNQSKD
jgi:hypothetical protein